MDIGHGCSHCLLVVGDEPPFSRTHYLIDFGSYVLGYNPDVLNIDPVFTLLSFPSL